MTGVQARISVQHFDRLAEAMNGLLRLRADPAAMLDDLGMQWLTLTQDRFEAERDPDGGKWQPTQRGGAILRDTNRLFQRLTYEVQADGVAVGSNVVYSAIHQFGGQAGRGRKVSIAPRPYLGVGDGDVPILEGVMIDHIERALAQAGAS